MQLCRLSSFIRHSLIDLCQRDLLDVWVTRHLSQHAPVTATHHQHLFRLGLGRRKYTVV